MHCVLPCMLGTVEGERSLLEALKVLRVMRCMVLGMLGAVEGWL